MASFHNSSTQFLRLRGVLSLVSSNFSKLSDSRVKIQIHFSLFERFARVFNFLGFSPLGGFNFLVFSPLHRTYEEDNSSSSSGFQPGVATL